MKDVLIAVIKTGLPLALTVVMFAEGLGFTPGEQLRALKQRPLLILRSVIVVVVLVPLAALVILKVLAPPPAVAIGLAILAASPAAPFQLRNISQKVGSLVYLNTLHLSLALLAIVSVPVVLDVSSAALGFEFDVGVMQVAATVAKTILVPVLLGLAVRSIAPTFALRIGPPLGRIAELILYVIVVAILVSTAGLLLKMEPWSYFVIGTFIVVNLFLGHALGPTDDRERTILAMESGARNFGLAVTIGVLNFSREQVLPVFIPYIVMFVIISTIYLQWRRRHARGLAHPDASLQHG